MSSNPSLDALLTDAVASDYESTVADRHTSPVIKSLAAVASLILALTFVAAVVAKQQQSTELSATRGALISRIQAADQRVAAAQISLTQAQSDLVAAESAHLAGTSLGEQAQKLLTNLRRATGFTELTGPGLQVSLDDAVRSGNSPNGAIVPGVVQDRDLQAVVNGLWAAGATGISVNGQRLTARSAIRNAGDAILVDYRPLSPPYRVVAISDSADATAGIFRDGVAGLLLEELSSRYGVVWRLDILGTTTIPAAANTTSASGGQ